MKEISFNGHSFSMILLEELHPGGNKFYKLRLNLEAARNLQYTKLLSFGGAWSNHIHALAQIGQVEGFSTIGVIRGERPKQLSLMLQEAEKFGMHLEFVSREWYREKTDVAFIDHLQEKFGDFYLLPEGGTNALAVQGCGDIVAELETRDLDYDLLCLPVGTGGTLAGLALKLEPSREVIGFSVLKGAQYLDAFVESLLADTGDAESNRFEIARGKRNWSINHDYHCGGYAKCPDYLKAFITKFEQENDVMLDPVYTAKMTFGLCQLLDSAVLDSGKKIIAIHTGGSQGRRGFHF